MEKTAFTSTRDKVHVIHAMSTTEALFVWTNMLEVSFKCE